MHPEITGRLNNQDSSRDLYHSISNYWVTHVINMYIEIWRRPRAIFGLQVGQGQHQGGGRKRRGMEPRNDVLTTCKAVNPRDSQRSSKAAVCFLMISTLALSVG